MAKNTGKPSEKFFEGVLDSLGKRASYFRLVDASEITGRTGKIAESARAQPSDYIVTLDGTTFYAEVKSTQNKTSFPFSLLKPAQWAAGVVVTGARGIYKVYVHNLNTDRWYVVPFTLIKQVKDAGKASIPWEQLKDYQWTPTTST